MVGTLGRKSRSKESNNKLHYPSYQCIILSILIKNCDWILTQNPQRNILKNKSIWIEDKRIKLIDEKIERDADYTINGAGKVLMPGLINCHTHLSMSLLRGYADDMPLHEWLGNKIWPLESRMSGEISYAGALLGSLEMIRTGTTCFLDMYFFIEDIARAVKRSGLRAFISLALLDSFEPEKIGKIKNMAHILRKTKKEFEDEKIRFVLAPHAPYTCGEETLLKAKEVAETEDALLHIHLAETRKEQADFENRRGCREIEYLEKIGFLNSRVIAAHCVWLTLNEVRILGRRGVKVAHCPIANMKLATGGVAPLPEMFENKVVVGLGTDGPASNNGLDMFDTMKFCALLQKAHRWEPTVLPAQQVLDLCTIEAARALGIEKELGSIEIGKQADLILVDLKSPNLKPIHGPETVVSDLVYSARGLNVDTTIVAGEPLMISREFLTLNEDEVYQGADEAFDRLRTS